MFLLATQSAGESVQFTGEGSVSVFITLVAGNRASFTSTGQGHGTSGRDKVISLVK